MTKQFNDFTLPDSGVTVRIKRIGPPLANDLRRKLKTALPKPVPPTQSVDLGGEIRREPNLSHPDYLAALGEYTADLGVLFFEELVRYGVDADMDAADTVVVSALRESDTENRLPKGDIVVYVTRVAVESSRDMLALQDAILGRFQPTEKAVAEATETFPGDVQGA